MLLGNTRAVLSLEKLCEEFGYSYHWTSGHKPHLMKEGKKFHRDTSNYVQFVVPGLCKKQTTYHSLSLVCWRVPTSSSSTSPTSSSQEAVTDTEIPPTRRSESTDELARSRPVAWISRNRHPKWKWRRRQIGHRSSSMDWLMNVFQNIETLPVLLMNYFWSREQKWYRVNTIFLFISRKSGIAISGLQSSEWRMWVST